MSDVSFRDFQPFNTWVLDANGPKWSTGEPQYLIDASTQKKYWNESKGCVRFKCLLLTLGTPVVHGVASLVSIARRVVKLVTLSHFRGNKVGEQSYSYLGRLKDAGHDLLKIIATPLAFGGLEFAALYGIFSPYNGRKLYASIERAQYGSWMLAPCFQPNATCHAFGGNPNKKNAF